MALPLSPLPLRSLRDEASLFVRTARLMQRAGMPMFHPTRIAGGLKGILEDPNDTRHVFTLFESMIGPLEVRHVGHFLESDEGRALFAKRPPVVQALADRDGLRRMPEGSLGRAYLAFVEAEGITAEVRQRQAEKAQLIEIFLTSPDEATFQHNIEQYDAELDYDFFELFTGYIQSAQMAGDESKAQMLFALREHLAKSSSQGQLAVAQLDAQMSAEVAKRQEQLLEQLREARNNEQRERLIADNYELLDLTFFEQVAAKIDQAAHAGDSVTANSLKALRSNILFLKTEYEKKTKAALEKGEELFKQIIQSDQPDQIIKKNLAQIDESFFFVLGTNIERARQQGQTEPAQAMEKIGQVAVTLLQQRQTSKL